VTSRSNVRRHTVAPTINHSNHQFISLLGSKQPLGTDGMMDSVCLPVGLVYCGIMVKVIEMPFWVVGCVDSHNNFFRCAWGSLTGRGNFDNCLMQMRKHSRQFQTRSHIKCSDVVIKRTAVGDNADAEIASDITSHIVDFSRFTSIRLATLA